MTNGGHVTAKGARLQDGLEASWSPRGLWTGLDVSGRLLTLQQTQWGQGRVATVSRKSQGPRKQGLLLRE